MTTQIVIMPDAETASYSAVEDQGFGALVTAQGPLPLKALDRQYRDCLLVAVTEKRTREEIDAYCRALATAVA